MSAYLLSAAEGSYLLQPSQTAAHFAAVTLGELLMLDVLALRRRFVKKHKRDPRPVEQTFLEKGREWANFHPRAHHEVLLKKIRRDGRENILSMPRRLRAELGDGIPKFIGKHLLTGMRAHGFIRKLRLPVFSALTAEGKEMQGRLQRALGQVDALPYPELQGPAFSELLKNLGGLLLLHPDLSFDTLGRLGEGLAEKPLADLALQGGVETGKSPAEMLYDWNGVQLLPAWKLSRFLDVFMRRFMKSCEVEEDGSGGWGFELLDLIDV